MTGFAADWLALRAPADARARSATLMTEAAALAMDRAAGERVRIVDLGAGTGATVRALAPHVNGPQSWTLMDADAGLLIEARQLLTTAPPAPDLTVTTTITDLSADLTFAEPPHLVTASALFDITSAAFMATLADRLAKAGVPLLALLTYDGRKTITPSNAYDDAMLGAFNEHQRGEKTFGRAAGPDAADWLARALEEAGASVRTADSAWSLTRAENGALIDAMLDGWAEAAAELRPSDKPQIDEWRAFHANAETMQVGHLDLLARFGP